MSLNRKPSWTLRLGLGFGVQNDHSLVELVESYELQSTLLKGGHVGDYMGEYQGG